MFPVTHGMIGWLTGQSLENRRDRILVTAASVIPDFDGAGIVVSLDYYAKYHHVLGHNIFFGLIFAALAYKFSIEKKKGAVLALVAFHSHILGDLLGSGLGWGIPFFWPVYGKVFEFVPPFQWELDSWQNILTTAICLIGIIYFAIKKKRTIVEVFSVKADAKVVEVFRKWFGNK